MHKVKKEMPMVYRNEHINIRGEFELYRIAEIDLYINESRLKEDY